MLIINSFSRIVDLLPNQVPRVYHMTQEIPFLNFIMEFSSRKS